MADGAGFKERDKIVLKNMAQGIAALKVNGRNSNNNYSHSNNNNNNHYHRGLSRLTKLQKSNLEYENVQEILTAIENKNLSFKDL